MLTEIGARRLIGRVCRKAGLPVPRVVYLDYGYSFYLNGVATGESYPVGAALEHKHRKHTIVLSSPQWVKDHKANTAMGYRLLVLHETAHYLTGLGHTGEFYAYLFSLCDLWGVPLSFAFADELGYKARAAVEGIELFLRKMRENCG